MRAKGLWLSAVLLAGAGGSGLCLTFSLPALAAGHQTLSLPSPTVPALPSPSLPVPSPKLPLPSPSLPPLLASPIPTPSLPVSGAPSPSLPPVGATPSPSGSPVAPGSGGSGSGGRSHGISIPFTTIVVSSPLDVALLASIAILPLLFGIWVLLFGRTWARARQARDAQVRMIVANDLGLSPRELISVSTKALFKLREEAAFDDLTGVLRRAAGMSALDREIHRARRQKTPLAVAFIDLDGLKLANDKRGHKAGDELLRGLASALKSGLRGQDLVVRYGGDEFVCVLPDTIADAGRAKMSWVQTEAGKAGIRFSVGLAQLERSDDIVSLLGRADREMYEAKARRGAIRALHPDREGGRRVSA